MSELEGNSLSRDSALPQDEFDDVGVCQEVMGTIFSTLSSRRSPACPREHVSLPLAFSPPVPCYASEILRGCLANREIAVVRVKLLAIWTRSSPQRFER